MKHYEVLKKFFLSLVLGFFVFVLTYLRFFLLGHTVRQFFAVQKYVIAFYESGVKGNPTTALQILLADKWPTWWGPTLSVSEWNILWPLSFLATLYYFYLVILKRKKYNSSLFAIWVVLYLIFLAFVPTWPRYLLVVLPFMYNLTICILSKSTLPY